MSKGTIYVNKKDKGTGKELLGKRDEQKIMRRER
jgi:hypothetical protein